MEHKVMNNVRVYGLEESVIASGYPMKKSYHPELIEGLPETLTKKDWKRAKNLANTPPASGHDCFLKGVIVQFDLTITEKMWPQFQRYTFADFVSSMSTIHMLSKMNAEYIKYTDKKIIKDFEDIVDDFNHDPSRDNWLRMIYSYPSGLLLTARITTNYLQLKNIYKQRDKHPLPEWEWFRKEMFRLPHFKEWCTGGKFDDSET